MGDRKEKLNNMSEDTKQSWEKRFDDFMDNYIRHAGEWHNYLCVFVLFDHGVCECNLKKNNNDVKQFITAELKKQREDILERLPNQLIEVAMPGSKYTLDWKKGYNEVLYEIKQIINNQKES